MFFVFSKLFAVLLSPIVWIISLFIIAYFLQNKRNKKKYFITALIIFYFFSNRFIAEEVIRIWEIDSVSNIDLQNYYDAGIVLGGGLVSLDEENNRLVYGQSADRIMQAIEMLKQKKINKIIISGGSGSLLENNDVESVLMKRFLINIGIKPTDILIDSLSRNTYENAIETKKIIESNFPKGKFLLFTSAIHMRRAKSCFAKQYINFDYYTTNNIHKKRNYSIDYMLIPSSLAIYQWEALLHEITGFVIYKLIGYT